MLKFLIKRGEPMLDFMTEKHSSWEKIAESGKPVVIYGMGNGADKVLDELYRLEIPVKGVTASDDFVRGQLFRGFKVKKLAEFYGDFVIAVAFASSIPEVMNKIYSLEENYRVLVPVVPVYGNEIFSREFIDKNKESILKAYSLFDEKSRKIYAGCVDFMFGGELSVLKSITTEKSEAFTGFFKPRKDEAYLDLGAYRGDTVDELLKYSDGSYSSITALEPDIKTFKKLTEHLSGMPNCTLLQKAVSDYDGTVLFENSAGRQSAIGKSGKETECVRVDTLSREQRFTYIKADVEGGEKAMLRGASETLKRDKPRLNIALYHRSEDIFTLPLLINKINSEYEFHLCRHPYIPCWDMNLYCL